MKSKMESSNAASRKGRLIFVTYHPAIHLQTTHRLGVHLRPCHASQLVAPVRGCHGKIVGKLNVHDKLRIHIHEARNNSSTSGEIRGWLWRCVTCCFIGTLIVTGHSEHKSKCPPLPGYC